MHTIDLKPSRLLGLLLLAMALLALAALAVPALPTSARIVIAALVVVLGLGEWKRTRVHAVLRLRRDGTLQVRDAEGAWTDIDVLGDSFVSPLLIVLRYRVAEARRVRSLTLLPDSGDADSLRRLRAALRWIPRRRSDTSSPDAG